MGPYYLGTYIIFWKTDSFKKETPFLTKCCKKAGSKLDLSPSLPTSDAAHSALFHLTHLYEHVYVLSTGLDVKDSMVNKKT